MQAGLERSPVGHGGRLWIGAPAVVMLATCVSAQAAPSAEDLLESAEQLLPRCAAPDLGWVLQGGAACSAKQARKALAFQAAYVIHTLDRLSCTRTCGVPEKLDASAHGQHARRLPLAANPFKQLDPARSTHQFSAP